MKPWFTQDEYPSELSEADEVQDGRMKLKVLIFLEVLVFTLLDNRIGENWFLTGYGPSTLPLRRRSN
ncbi:hypothetical protein LAZ67_12000200 [Cordylochernes scorpioides]|uniref:Uncharacterized protein n=1 Tax=Cordylochernes scorpioides TaxID=51811 RepID=A0ABY6L134_9ARAC|nr:hypothetical protein LAZ67_12000200 [Cordylochernes scorpioides]